MKTLFTLALILTFVACESGQSPTPDSTSPPPTVDLSATVNAAVAGTAAAESKFQTAVASSVESTRESLVPSPTPSPTMIPTATPTPIPTATPTPSPTPETTGKWTVDGGQMSLLASAAIGDLESIPSLNVVCSDFEAPLPYMLWEGLGDGREGFAVGWKVDDKSIVAQHWWNFNGILLNVLTPKEQEDRRILMQAILTGDRMSVATENAEQQAIRVDFELSGAAYAFSKIDVLCG